MYKILTDTPSEYMHRYIATVPAIVSILIAELFYKWGSFGLELFGFLLTWFAADWGFTKVIGKIRSSRSPTPTT